MKKKIFACLLLLITGSLIAQNTFTTGINLPDVAYNVVLNQEGVPIQWNMPTGEEGLECVVIAGIPPKEKMPEVIVPKNAVTLSEVPAFSWSFGCSATAAAMCAGYYDRSGFPNMYTGPTNGGFMPLDNSTWGGAFINGEWRALCPLSATRNGLDGRTTRGHVDDYWINYGSTADDPYITNGWTQHTHEDCTGDFMKTNQSAYNITDGATRFYYYNNNNPYSGSGNNNDDGCYGAKLFFESRDYSVTTFYNQRIYGYNGTNNGFTFGDYKNEINAGRPVLIHVLGHTMLGIGYDDVTQTVYLHDTWDYSQHEMIWGGSYGNMLHYMVSVINLEEPEPSSIHTVYLPTGWSGLSAYISPANPDIEAVFENILDDLAVVLTNENIFYPAYNINTIGSWTQNSAYKVKTNAATILEIVGEPIENKTLSLSAGWKLIPVLSECDTDVAELFNGTDASIVKEVAGTGIYWPEFGINTLSVVEPGKAYFVLMESAEEITFPECQTPSNSPLRGRTNPLPKEVDGVRGGTPFPSRGRVGDGVLTSHTPITHTIAIPTSAIGGLDISAEDLLKAIDNYGNCYGAAVWNEETISLTLFGDDPTTTSKDGFAVDETISFKIYRPAREEEFDLEVSYENRFDSSGLFYTNGMSVVKAMKASSTGMMNHEFSGVKFFPNPTSGIFNIEGLNGKAMVSIFNAFGEEVMQIELLTSGRINLSGQAKGVYFIRIESEKGSHFEKVILN